MSSPPTAVEAVERVVDIVLDVGLLGRVAKQRFAGVHLRLVGGRLRLRLRARALDQPDEAVLARCAAASAPPRPVLLGLVPAVLFAERVELVAALLGPPLVLRAHLAGLRCTDPFSCRGKREGALAELAGLEALFSYQIELRFALN